MSTKLVAWSAVFGLAMAGHAAHADTLLFSDNFSSITTTQFGDTANPTTAPANWKVLYGTVDNLAASNGFVSCSNGGNGCVDLDGTTNFGAMLVTKGATANGFQLNAGQQYQFRISVSGNQRDSNGEGVQFGFTNAAGSSLFQSQFNVVASTQNLANFTLFTLSFTPVTTLTGVWLFVHDYSYDTLGAILNGATLSEVTPVPLPASAWLLLTGLLGLGVMSRRRSTLQDTVRRNRS